MKDLVVTTNPKSAFAEAIKLIKTNIAFSSIDTNLKTILMTSPESGDGKSFLVANLATAFAQENKKVLIIDADLRRGRQHEIFNIENDKTKGYSNLIRSVGQHHGFFFSGSLSEIFSYIKGTSINNISLLPAGPTPPNPLELLSSGSNRLIIDQIKESFDIVLIDCPPALGLSDVLVMSKFTDVNIVTISNAKTKINQLEDVKKNFDRVNSKISGIIVNKTKQKQNAYSSYYANNKYYTED